MLTYMYVTYLTYIYLHIPYIHIHIHTHIHTYTYTYLITHGSEYLTVRDGGWPLLLTPPLPLPLHHHRGRHVCVSNTSIEIGGGFNRYFSIRKLGLNKV
jgi:hypothetical protein